MALPAPSQSVFDSHVLISPNAWAISLVGLWQRGVVSAAMLHRRRMESQCAGATKACPAASQEHTDTAFGLSRSQLHTSYQLLSNVLAQCTWEFITAWDEVLNLRVDLSQILCDLWARARHHATHRQHAMVTHQQPQQSPSSSPVAHPTAADASSAAAQPGGVCHAAADPHPDPPTRRPSIRTSRSLSLNTLYTVSAASSPRTPVSHSSPGRDPASPRSSLCHSSPDTSSAAPATGAQGRTPTSPHSGQPAITRHQPPSPCAHTTAATPTAEAPLKHRDSFTLASPRLPLPPAHSLRRAAVMHATTASLPASHSKRLAPAQPDNPLLQHIDSFGMYNSFMPMPPSASLRRAVAADAATSPQPDNPLLQHIDSFGMYNSFMPMPPSASLRRAVAADAATSPQPDNPLLQHIDSFGMYNSFMPMPPSDSLRRVAFAHTATKRHTVSPLSVPGLHHLGSFSAFSPTLPEMVAAWDDMVESPICGVSTPSARERLTAWSRSTSGRRSFDVPLGGTAGLYTGRRSAER